jgi:hypothetical protein
LGDGSLPTYHNSVFKEFPKLSDIDLAWLAGLFEGEGCACIAHNSDKRPYLKVALGQNGDYTANLIQSITESGSVHLHRDHKKNNYFMWHVSCTGARLFLHAIRPFMRLPHKIKQVDEALAADAETHVNRGLIKNYKRKMASGKWKYKPLPYELVIS